MSLMRWPSNDQIQKNFDECLKDAVELGQWPPSDQGFDEDVDVALRQVAKSYPDVRGDLVASARLALAGQFDGSNTQRRLAEMAAIRSAAERK